MGDLVSLASLLGITPAVREAYFEVTKAGAPNKDAAPNPVWIDVEPLTNYQNQIALIQRDSVW